MEEAISVINKLAAGGLATLLIAILVAGKYKIWVWGYAYEEMVKEKDAQIAYERAEKNEWRQLAWETRSLTEKSVSLATKAVQQ